MIGALLAKRFAVRGFRAISRKDLATVVSGFDEHAVLEFPGRTEMSGRFEGRRAIERYFRAWFARRERIVFHLKHVCVESPFAVGATNTVAVEWDVDETDLDGVTYRLSGVTVLEARRGKVVRARDYVFDHDALARAWPARPTPPAAPPATGG